MPDDVVLNKAEIIERCVARVRVVYAGDPRHLTDDITRQDSIILNLQRACEAAIDLAMHLVRERRLGIPQETRDAFDLLVQAGVIGSDLGTRLKKMVGFRNVAVHAYRQLDLQIVLKIVTAHVDDFLEFTQTVLRQN